MKFGLIELFVDLNGILAESASDAVCKGIRQDPQKREETVRGAVDAARRCGCDFVVLPGWTLEASKPPGWLVELSLGRTIVFECLHPLKPQKTQPVAKKGKITPTISTAEISPDASDYPWRTFVAEDGKLVVGPARQRVVQAADLWSGEVLSENALALVSDLLAEGPIVRRWSVSGVGDAMLLICGEANFVGGGGRSKCWNHETVEKAGLTVQRLTSLKVIANPSHTRSGPQALRDKRAWLSRGGILLHTANIHSNGWKKVNGDGAVPGKASHQAAIAWVQGEREPVKLVIEAEKEREFVLKSVEWSPCS